MKKTILLLLSLATVKSFAYLKADCQGVTSDVAKLQRQGYEIYQKPVNLKLSGYEEKITLESQDLNIGTATVLEKKATDVGDYYAGKVSCNHVVNGGITEMYCGEENKKALMMIQGAKAKQLEASTQLNAKQKFQVTLAIYEKVTQTEEYTFSCETTFLK